MKNSFFLSATLIFMLTIFSGCLTCETKTYKFELTGKGGGKLTITYYNIFSKSTDEEITPMEEMAADFDELIYDYTEGDKLIADFPNAKMVSRRLFEANGKLNGEVVYEFTNINQAHLFQTTAKGPYMYLLNAMTFETVQSTNGQIGPEYFKMVYWSRKFKNLEFTSSIDAMDESSTSLLEAWKASKK
jgi:hypothetical protein